MNDNKLEFWLSEKNTELLSAWRRMGLCDSEAARLICLNEAEYQQLKELSAAFADGLLPDRETGMFLADTMVESALYKKAVEGNFSAMSFWLRNRRPEFWASAGQAVKAAAGFTGQMNEAEAAIFREDGELSGRDEEEGQ